MPTVKKIKGRYEIKSVLGEGGMGVVYRAYDPPPMNREVALKTLLEFPDQTSLQLFYKECEVLKSMSHPNIVEIFDIGEFEDGGQKKPFFVMPLLRGQTLDELIRNSSHRLSVERVVEIIAQTCRGLQAAHERGLVHRDLKPSNLWVMEDNSVKIIDFGVAHTMDSHTRTSGFQKGTLLYMAPEQILFKPVSPQSDIFSLGVVCYEALTRRQPFRGTTEDTVVNAILKYIPPPASEINPSVNQAISRVVHKAMAKQPWNRYDTTREFGETLQKALRNEPIELFDPARIKPRITRAAKALENGDYQFADEIVAELEAEGNLDPELTLLRTQVDQVVRQKTIAQLLESARARFEEDEDPLALQKIQDILQLDPNNVAALGLKSKIENRRSERQVDKWLRLAQQHVDNHSYGHAREALRNVTQLRANDPRAKHLLDEIETNEREYLRLRQRKAQVYQSALNAWKNGEVSQALADMGMVLELDRQAPDTSSPETSSQYQKFYNQVRSEHDTMNGGYAEAGRALAEGDYAKALKLCQEFLAKYPNQALFQALKFDVEEQQRQQLSAFIADVNRRLEAERDLEAKVNLLREALAAYPGEAHFEKSLRLMTDKRDLVNSILARSHSHEQQGQINEALNDLETLRTIYSPYPGLQFEIERLQKKREQQAREEAKARWIEQVERQRETANYPRALNLLQKAGEEFPNDSELTELEKLVRQDFERSAHAEELLARGQQLCTQGNLSEGIETLRQARQLDHLNPAIAAALRDALVERARGALETDWHSAEELAAQALELDPSDAQAKSIRAQVLDRKRDEAVGQHASKARRLQAAGDLNGAVAEVEEGLKEYPSEARLTSIQSAIRKELSQVQQKQQERSRDLEAARSLYKVAEAGADKDKLNSIYERTQSFVAKHPEDSELQTIAREVQRIVKARGEAKPTPASKPKVATTQRAKPPGPSLQERLRPLLTSRALQMGAAAVGIIALALISWHFRPHGKSSQGSVRLLPFEIRTTPPGASLRVNGQETGTSPLRLELRPGDYQIEASLSGYESAASSFSVGEGKPETFELTLPALQEPLRLNTDLEKGEVWLDNSQIGSLENGSFNLPNIAPGQHVLRIAAGNTQDATISFEVFSDAIKLAPSPQTHQLQVVAVSTAKGTTQLVSSMGSVPVTIDDKPNGQIGPEGMEVAALAPGLHELVLGKGKDARTMSFEIGSAPALDANVFSDRDVGSILIATGQEDVEVLVDDKPYPRRTQHERLIILNLKPKVYRIRIHKDGFIDPGEQNVEVLKGQEAKVAFELKPAPSMATLQLEHLRPGTQVSLDDKPIGTVGPDGTFSHGDIAAGQHRIGLFLAGYESKRIDKNFVEGSTVTLSAGELQMTTSRADLEIVVAENTQVTISQGTRKISTLRGSGKIPLEAGDYTISAPGMKAEVVNLAAGESKTVELRSSSFGMDRWENASSWTEQGGWYTHRGGGFVLYDAPTHSGEYVFTLRFKRGHWYSGGHREKWAIGYVDAKNYILIELDGKFLYRTIVVNDQKESLPKVPHKIGDAQSVTFSLDVEPSGFTHRYTLPGGHGWQSLDTYPSPGQPSLQAKPKSFAEGKFGFYLPNEDTIEISNFSFYPK